jgi:hypothetical protein
LIRFASLAPEPIIQPHSENIFIKTHVDGSAAGRTVAFNVAGGVRVVDVQVLEFGREGPRYDEFKAGPCRPIEGNALCNAEWLTHDVLSYVADREAAGHVGQKAVERISKPEARGRDPPDLEFAIDYARSRRNAGIYAAPIEIEFFADNKAPKVLRVVADRAADETARDRYIAVRPVRVRRPGYVPPAAATVDAEIESGPIINRWDGIGRFDRITGITWRRDWISRRRIEEAGMRETACGKCREHGAKA